MRAHMCTRGLVYVHWFAADLSTPGASLSEYNLEMASQGSSSVITFFLYTTVCYIAFLSARSLKGLYLLYHFAVLVVMVGAKAMSGDMPPPPHHFLNKSHALGTFT